MQGVLALLLIQALIATSSVTSLLHTHAYHDHDHPEHHHGPALHQHHPLSAHPDDRAPHLEGCDPGNHAMRFAFVCAAPPQVHACDAEISLPASLEGEPQLERVIRPGDVRVHGPPPPPQPSPRAPPLIDPRLIT